MRLLVSIPASDEPRADEPAPDEPGAARRAHHARPILRHGASRIRAAQERAL